MCSHYLGQHIAIFLFSLDKPSPYQFPYNMCAQGTRLISVNQIHIRPMSNLCRLLSSKNSEMWNRFKTANFRPVDLDVGGPHIFFVRGIRKTTPSIVCVSAWLIRWVLKRLGKRWYRVSKGIVCLYIFEKVEIWLGVTDASQTHRQQNIELLSFSPV